MGLDVYDAIALTIYARDDHRLASRTTMQKLIYFHTVIIKGLDIPRYTPHFYGPYNRNVSIALEEMSEFSYIDQRIISRYYDTHVYKLTEAGVRYAENAAKKYPAEYERMGEIIRACDDHCKLKPSPLSYAAKSHYIMASSGGGAPRSPGGVRSVAKDFDWDISEDDVREGISLLQKLGLAS